MDELDEGVASSSPSSAGAAGVTGVAAAGTFTMQPSPGARWRGSGISITGGPSSPMLTIDDKFMGFGNYRIVLRDLLSVAEQMKERSTTWKHYTETVLEDELDIAVILKSEFSKHAKKGSILYGLIMTLLMGVKKRKLLRQRTMGNEEIWQGWSHGNLANYSNFLERSSSSTALTAEDLARYVRNLQAKTEMIVHIILSIRFDGKIVTDWTT